MKPEIFFVMAVAVMQITAGCQNRSAEQATLHYHWECGDGEHAGAVIAFARMGDVFRGEYIDPGFQEFCSVPIAGTIDGEGHVNGMAMAETHDGNIYAALSGQITGDRFRAVWTPTPSADAEYREMEMRLKKQPLETEKEIRNPSGAFHNRLYPERTLCTDNGSPKSRTVPFIPVQAVADRQSYGYRIGEWEERYIRIEPASKDGEADFHLHIHIDGQFTTWTDIAGTAQLKGNIFRYREKDYEFEAVIYTGFVVIKTIAGTIAPSGDGMADGELKADGIYPLPAEMSFYRAAGNEAETDGGMEDRIIADILSLPELQYENAAAEIVGIPSDEEPYFTVRAGSNMDDHFAVSNWFHVYTEPDYEIKVYGVFSDAEMTLQQWRDFNGEITLETFLAYVKLDAELPDGQLRLLMDKLLWIDGFDTVTLRKYGFDPDNVYSDYILYNESEEWLPSVTVAGTTTFRTIRADSEGSPTPCEVDLTGFRQDIAERFVYNERGEKEERTLLAEMNTAFGLVFSVREVYVP